MLFILIFIQAHYKVYIHIPCINTQRQKTASFDITNVISSSNRQTPRLYKGPANCCEGDHNSDIIRLLQPYHTIHYCNQSMLAIVPDLNIASGAANLAPEMVGSFFFQKVHFSGFTLLILF